MNNHTLTNNRSLKMFFLLLLLAIATKHLYADTPTSAQAKTSIDKPHSVETFVQNAVDKSHTKRHADAEPTIIVENVNAKKLNNLNKAKWALEVVYNPDSAANKKVMYLYKPDEIEKMKKNQEKVSDRKTSRTSVQERIAIVISSEYLLLKEGTNNVLPMETLTLPPKSDSQINNNSPDTISSIAKLILKKHSSTGKYLIASESKLPNHQIVGALLTEPTY